MKKICRFIMFLTMPIWLLPMGFFICVSAVWKDFNDALDGKTYGPYD